MEGKCNKAPNAGSNNNTANSKYMDHVYCHTSQPPKSAYSSNMTTAGSGGGPAATPNSDVLALLKENKQLKGMLILHLDLIQEQSDQLMAKDKALITQNEELETLRARNAALENHVQDLQRQLQRQIKRSGEMSTLPPPPLAKIQCKSSVAVSTPALVVPAVITNVVQKPSSSKGTTNIIGECNGQFISKIVLQRVPLSRSKRAHQSPQSQQSTDSEHEDEEDEEHERYDEIEIDNDEEETVEGEEEEDELDEESRSIHDPAVENQAEENEVEVDLPQDAGTHSVHEQTVILDELYDTGNSTEDSNEVLAVQSKRLRMKQAAKQSLAIPRGAKPSVSPASTTTNDGKTAFKAVTSSNSSTHPNLPNQPVLSRGKQMTIMRWHAPDYHTDESVSCDSNAETEKRSTTSVTSCSPPKPAASSTDKKRYHKSHDPQHSHPRTKARRCTYISTPQLYSSREWEDEAFNCDFDFEGLKTESKIFLGGDAPKLEIPKWTEHDLTPSYCIEGTEDLSDDVFLKRHAKLEVDEKRRKKWDVQQIREQRRIERLKRRHYKDNAQQTQETAALHSFYPTTESLQTICFVQDLPVQAFGEMIPRLMVGTNGDRKDFSLPWLNKVQCPSLSENKKPTVSILKFSNETASSLQAQQQMLNSSFVILKKRKRQQSSSYGTTHHTSRQRSLAAKIAQAATTTPQTITTAPSTLTISSAPVTTSTALPLTATTRTSCNYSNIRT